MREEAPLFLVSRLVGQVRQQDLEPISGPGERHLVAAVVVEAEVKHLRAELLGRRLGGEGVGLVRGLRNGAPRLCARGRRLLLLREAPAAPAALVEDLRAPSRAHGPRRHLHHRRRDAPERRAGQRGALGGAEVGNARHAQAERVVLRDVFLLVRVRVRLRDRVRDRVGIRVRVRVSVKSS